MKVTPVKIGVFRVEVGSNTNQPLYLSNTNQPLYLSVLSIQE
jgi:hypothetical protein